VPSRPSSLNLSPFLLLAAQILVAGMGGILFQWLGVPAAWLSGSVVATVVWGALGWSRPLPKGAVDTAMLVSGATMGASVTPEAVAAMTRYPLSLMALVLGVFAISASSALWLTRVSGWRRDDALLASVPGALSTVLAVAADRKADVASIAIVQSFRLFVLIALLPGTVVLLGGGGAGAMLLGEGRPVASPVGLAVVLAGGVAAGLVFQKVGLAAPILLGATVVSTGLHITGATVGGVPPIIATAGLVLIGIFIAERFRNLNRDSLRKAIPAALGSFTVGMGVAALFSGVAAWLAQVTYANALVAFAPGGLEAMMVLALILGLDPLYVGIHHLARFLGIGLVIPFLIPWLQRQDRRNP
jgi:membrane AbrB-like protein